MALHFNYLEQPERSPLASITLLNRNGAKYCSVLLDLNIPPPDGIEVARHINDNLPTLPVVVLSGYPDLANRIRTAAFSGIVKLILVKPAEPQTIVAHVHRSCTGRVEWSGLHKLT